jgi:16S rRNA (cytosine1402-N4)-methyltransferase
MDATIGSGGHSLEILKKIIPGGYLLGLDVDEEALERARERLKPFEGHFKLYRENYKNLMKVMEQENLEKIDGLLLDLGLSSEQVEDPGRGFSFRKDGPLDMRYDLRQEEKASDVVNRETRERLAEIFRNYGEERKANLIARLIEEKRKIKPIETTMELTRIAARAKAYSAKEKINPATRIFQALRIYINQELENLEMALTVAIRVISKGGRIGVISYHSLEDRLVKRFFRERAAEGVLRLITPHPLVPSKEEIKENRRSRSAKMRVAEPIL